MQAQAERVVILGAGGRLGQALVAAFAEADWTVRAQLRNPARWQQPSRSTAVEPVFCDALDRAALCRAAEGAAVVVNALNPVYTAWPQQARRLGQNALAAARANGALLLFPGVVYNFGNSLPEVLTPDTAQVGNTPKARIRIDMEADLRAAAAAGVASVVLRAGDYLGGPRRGAWFDLAIVKDLMKGDMIYPGPPDLVHAWAYLPDFARTFVRVATRRAQLRGYRVYHFPGYAITGAELHHQLEQAVGHALRLRPLPWWSLQLATPFSPMARAVLQMRYLWQRPHRLVDTGLSELIGTVPKTPLPEALRASLQDLDMLPLPSVMQHV
jgi:nucleoside-diphosphate-sugar epimerase